VNIQDDKVAIGDDSSTSGWISIEIIPFCS
jgi:hypothetical protein